MNISEIKRLRLRDGDLLVVNDYAMVEALTNLEGDARRQLPEVWIVCAPEGLEQWPKWKLLDLLEDPPVAIHVRPRWKRVLRFPRTVYRHYKVTPDLRLALRLARLTLKELKHPLN